MLYPTRQIEVTATLFTRRYKCINRMLALKIKSDNVTL